MGVAIAILNGDEIDPMDAPTANPAASQVADTPSSYTGMPVTKDSAVTIIPAISSVISAERSATVREVLKRITT
jgi:nitrogen fixation/metabolism regulation signal transduction histidine kinase